MRTLRAFLIRLGGCFGRRRRERELAEEFESHLAMHVEDNLRSGMSAEQARREAALKLEGLEPVKESMRDRASLPWLEAAWQDFRYALRGLRRCPGFAVTAIMSLALGIGASVAIFTVVDNVLLRPLPYRDPSRLVMVWETHYDSRNVVSPGNYLDWKAQNEVFETMAAFRDGSSALLEGGRAEELREQWMSAELLPMLGVRPFRGRLFTTAEDRPGAQDALLISYRLWRRWFGGDEGIVGRKVQVNSTPRTIIGVLPAGFYFRNRATGSLGAARTQSGPRLSQDIRPLHVERGPHQAGGDSGPSAGSDGGGGAKPRNGVPGVQQELGRECRAAARFPGQ
jgi:MacB-like periplasmic core domain